MRIVSSGLSATRFQKALNQRHKSIGHLVYYIHKHIILHMKHNKVNNQINYNFVVERNYLNLTSPDHNILNMPTKSITTQ